MYIPPFSRLSRCLQFDKKAGTVTMPDGLFKKFVKAMSAQGGCDTQWYRSAYGDIAKAIQEGEAIDPVEHFSESGYFEGRKQRSFDVDEDWYLSRYPDIRASIASGKIASAHGHFNSTGYFEGRVPSKEWENDIEEWNSLIDKYTPVRQLEKTASLY